LHPGGKEVELLGYGQKDWRETSLEKLAHYSTGTKETRSFLDDREKGLEDASKAEGEVGRRSCQFGER